MELFVLLKIPLLKKKLPLKKSETPSKISSMQKEYIGK